MDSFFYSFLCILLTSRPSQVLLYILCWCLETIIKYALQHTLSKVIPNSFVPSNDVIHKSFLFLKHVQHLLIYGHENANEIKWNLFPSRSHYSTYGNMFINIRRSGENETKYVATLKSTANVQLFETKNGGISFAKSLLLIYSISFNDHQIDFLAFVFETI